MNYIDSPDYLKSADLHNIGAGNKSFFDSPIESTVEAISNAPKFAITSIASGINSIYNSGVAAGNFFGITNAEENDIERTLSSFDTSLGNYYNANKQATDLVGFVATSFIPGIGGIKLLNAGQKMLSGAMRTGKLGETLASTTGLAVTASRSGLSLTEIAGQSLAKSGQTFSLMNEGVIKAMAGKFAEATLQAAAFETMVQATMFRSPILENQDIKDIGSNILTGTLLGGAIGGAIGSAGVYGGIKKILTAADLEQKKFTLMHSRAGFEKSPELRILAGAADLAATPAATNAAEEALRKSRLNTIELERREAIHALSNGDKELANFLADSTTGMSAEQIVRAYQGAKLVMRPGTLVSATEGNIAGFVRLHGDDVGEVTFDTLPPNRLTLADITPGGKDQILKAVNSHQFSSSKPWNVITASNVHEVEARYIWADKLAKYADEMTIGENDIPLLEGALKRGLSVNIENEAGKFLYKASDLEEYLIKRKIDLADELAEAKKQGWGFGVGPEGKNVAVSTITSDEIARALNVSVKRLESDESASLFARQDAQAAYDKLRKERGLVGEVDLDFIPRHAAVIYDTAQISATGDTAAALTFIKYQQKIQQEATDKAVASIVGEDLNGRLVRPGDRAILESNRYGAGAGLVTFANGVYRSLASWAEQIGKVTSDLKIKLRADTSAIMDSALLKLRGDQAAAIEFDKIKNIVASTTEKYVLNKDGTGLIAKRLQQYMDDVAAGKLGLEVPVLRGGAPDKIPFISPVTREAVISHIQANGQRISKLKDLRASLGLEDHKDADIFFAYKPDPAKMKFFAFVKDDTVTGAGAGHTSMIHAASAKDLEDMIQMVREKTTFRVYTKKDTEDFYRAQKSYEFDRTLHENYIDSSLKSAGINNQFFPKTDPAAIVDEISSFHAKSDIMLARETITTKFAHEFDQLETLGQSYTNVAGSRYAVNQRVIENTALNPYNDYRKTALDISRLNEYPIISSLNRTLEDAVSGVYDRIRAVSRQTASVNDLDKVNEALQAAGVNHAYKNAAEIVLANHSAPKPVVAQFVRRANAILASTFLRLDFLNPIANSVGAQVMLGTETSSQVRAMLRQLDETSVAVPGTGGDRIISAPKMIAKAQANFFSKDKTLLDWYKNNGYMTNISDQQKLIIDDLTLAGTETAADLNTRIGRAYERARKFGDIGEKVTGNRFAEEYNRFIAADVARQISDFAISKGILKPDGQLAYINTFVNRTQGNMLASQRPLIFQGPIGQALGLFQTYQFNIIQQLFRGISEGSMKDAAMMMGLQGTIFGLNGLPGFQYINQHIIGTASGNPNHRDAYTELYGAAGKEVGDWLMYGIPSNLLQTNLYTRGDINPRNLTIVPAAPQDIVAVSAFAKFAGNIKETLSKAAGGADVWQTVLQGIEHNGISRPLAGLAQTLQAVDGGKVFSTTGAGNVSFVNDLFSLATLSRLAGGKPLDESLVNDEVSRSMVYKAADRERMKKANEIFKTTVIAGEASTEDVTAATHNYMEAFVRNGGRQEDFNRVMLKAMTTANTPRANQIIETLKGPYAERMKSLMGGSVEGFEDE